MSRYIALRRSPIHGNGVFAARTIPSEHEVIEYRGLRLTQEQADDMYDGGIETGHTFLFTLNDDYVIDGGQRGNIARWINHSCDPNCQAFLIENKVGDPARDRVVIEAKRSIRRGEELTYDYGIRLPVRHTEKLKKIWACRCGSKNCTGTMLKPKR